MNIDPFADSCQAELPFRNYNNPAERNLAARHTLAARSKPAPSFSCDASKFCVVLPCRKDAIKEDQLSRETRS